MRHSQGGLGIAVGMPDTDLHYADEAVLLVEVPDQWPSALQRFDVKAGNMDLHTSWQRNQRANIGIGPPLAATVVTGQAVESIGNSHISQATSTSPATPLRTITAESDLVVKQ